MTTPDEPSGGLPGGGTQETEQSSYRIADDDESTRREQQRLQALARFRDPRTIRFLEACNPQPDWRCLEVGAGSGSISCWLAEQVGPDGHVTSTDVDLRFHGEVPGNVTVHRHDVVHDPLPARRFDLIHARAVLQHIPERYDAFGKLVKALKPGGWLVVEEGDWSAFENQDLPEPIATVARAMNQAARLRDGWDPNLGPRLLHWFRDHDLGDLTVEGESWTMRGNDDSGEWWFLAVEHVAPLLVEMGSITQEHVEGALAQVRHPEFAMLSPLSLAVRGRRPG